MFRILVYEETLSSCTETLFTPYRVDFAYQLDDILDLSYHNTYNLYLVNLNSFSVIKELKESGDTTATLFIDEYYSLQNMKKALQIGDEYIVKPVYIEELAIRLDYYYRKSFKHLKNIVTYKNFYYHTQSKQLFEGTKKIKLSPNELKLLELLLSHINKPLSKELITENIESSSGSLRVYISKLNKLGFETTYDRSITSYILISETSTVM